MTQHDAGALFDPKGKEGTKERPDTFPESWPGQRPIEGQGVCGQVAGYRAFRGELNDDMVNVVELRHVVEYVPGTDRTGGKLYPTGEVAIIIGAGLRNRVSDSRLPVGSLVSIRYTGADPEKRGMKTYEVHEVSRDHLARLHEAAKGQPKRVTESPAPAPAKGDDDLPF